MSEAHQAQSPLVERRPAVVTFIAVLLYIQAALALIVAVLYAIIPLLVLWALWGHDKGEAYFHRISA